jgi:hypothetical protein
MTAITLSSTHIRYGKEPRFVRPFVAVNHYWTVYSVSFPPHNFASVPARRVVTVNYGKLRNSKSGRHLMAQCSHKISYESVSWLKNSKGEAQRASGVYGSIHVGLHTGSP